MNGWRFTRRGLMLAAAVTALPRLAAAQTSVGAEITLTAEPGTLPLLGEGSATTPVWRFQKENALAVLRARQGQEFRVLIRNTLPDDIWFHWFGVRGPASMMNFLVEKNGGSFACSFTPPDAGTFWFGPLLSASAQRDRGLSGMLIVEEADQTHAMTDVPLVFDDWLLDDQGRMVEGFGDMNAAIAEGRLGNWFTVNGAFKPNIPLSREMPVRLRLLNVANMRTMNVQFKGADLLVMALDGQSVPLRSLGLEALSLAPGQRADLLMADAQGQVVVALDLFEDVVETAFLSVSGEAGDGLPDNFSLPANPLPKPSGIEAARHVPIVIAGGAGGGLASAIAGAETLDLRQLLERGLAWSINGIAGAGGPPLFAARSGETLVFDLDNRTAFAQSLHIHGHVWKLIELDGKPRDGEPWRDTTVIPARVTAKLLMVADNPGQWVLQSLLAERADAGLLGGFSVGDMP